MRQIIDDQKSIWTSPARVRSRDLKWLIPMAGLTATTLRNDLDWSARLAGNNVSFQRQSNRASHAGLLSLAAASGGFYLFGRWSGNAHARETGRLSTQAVANSLIFNQVLKTGMRRRDPLDNAGAGDFFVSRRPLDSSFASDHAIAAWSMASVIAHEYPGWLTRTTVYAAAMGVSLGRVTARRHFPADVLIGSAAGWLIGRHVYRSHHDRTLPGTPVDATQRAHVFEEASTYMPPDSWVYGAFDRLAALGRLRSDFSGLRPWTRKECLRLAREAQELSDAYGNNDTEAEKLIQALLLELEPHEAEAEWPTFKPELESIYTRVTAVSGTPLDDGMHLGNTFWGDFGRPLREGGNMVAGWSARAVHGRWSFYVRGEHQYSSSWPALPLAARQNFAAVDFTPLQPGVVAPPINRGRFLDSYFAYTFRDWQISLGKQSLVWGPGEAGAFAMSANAEPVMMLRLSRIAPFEFKGPLRFLGQARGEFFVGRLEGHRYIQIVGTLFQPPLPKQPFLNGAKISFKPTANLEFGLAVTSVYSGAGAPWTWRSFARSFTSSNTAPGQAGDPGDRRTSFDFKYRIPWLRDRLTLYNDSLAEDEPSPIGYPRRSSHAPGLYLSRIPFLPKADLRAEGFFTDLPGLRIVGAWYFNARFLSGFTNNGGIMGHPVGRQGSGYRVASTYWLTGQNQWNVWYRKSRVSPEFIQGGGSTDAFAVSHQRLFKSDFRVSMQVQVERWQFPIVAPRPQTNVATSFKLMYWPRQGLSLRLAK